MVAMMIEVLRNRFNPAIGPNVWSGRALQEVLSMRQIRSCINEYGLWLERVVLRAIMDISAHVI
jgi:hypothetical protein